MPFNSQSYYRNKAKREGLKCLAEARDIKRRLAAGDPRPGDSARALASAVLRARLSWQTYLGYLRLDEMDADMLRFRKGDMTYADFMAKWDTRGKDER